MLSILGEKLLRTSLFEIDYVKLATFQMFPEMDTMHSQVQNYLNII